MNAPKMTFAEYARIESSKPHVGGFNTGTVGRTQAMLDRMNEIERLAAKNPGRTIGFFMDALQISKTQAQRTLENLFRDERVTRWKDANHTWHYEVTE